MAIELLLLIPLALAGLTLLNTGLTRSRGSAQLMLASVCAICVAFVVFAVLGVSFVGFGSPGVAIHAAGKDWNVLGTGSLFARSVGFESEGASTVLLAQMLCAAMAALIPVASGAERWRTLGVAASSALLAGITFPIFLHWSSSDGWLGQIGFLDLGGAASIQALGGITALCISWILGPRSNKFTTEGIPTAMPGHNALFVLFGSMLALVGFFGLNLAGVTPVAMRAPGLLALAATNTLLAAAAGAIGAFVTTRIRFGKPDASLCGNGWVAGLVAISAAAPFVKPAGAILIGLLVGPVVVLAIELLEVHLHIDDPAGAISVHGIGGLWGVLAVSLFSDVGNLGSFLAQMLGIATLLGLMLPLTYGLNALVNRFVPYRVEPTGERQGMDLFELGSGAYPEFVTHREDFMRR